MTPTPPRINVPALIKRYHVFTLQRGPLWAASVEVNGQHYTCWYAQSKRKAVLSVLQQAGIEIQ